MSPLSTTSPAWRPVSAFVTLTGAAVEVVGLEDRHGVTSLWVTQVLVPGRFAAPDGTLGCGWLNTSVKSAGATFSSLYGSGAEATDRTEAGEPCLGRFKVELLREAAEAAGGLCRGSISWKAYGWVPKVLLNGTGATGCRSWVVVMISNVK